MTASTAAPLALTATGLTVLGVSTGLDPILLFAGAAGGLWSLSYIPEPMPVLQRLTVGAISALAGAWSGQWLASAAVAWLGHHFPWWPPAAGADALRYPTAMIVGLLAYRHIGPLLMRRAARLDHTGSPP